MLQGGGRLLGLDLGAKTIGLAISDDRWRIASPVRTLMRVKFTADAEALIAHADRERVTAYVLGLPLNMDGSEGPRAQSTRAFVRNLARLDDRPVLLQDERLSTHAAREAGPRRKGRIDDRAAAIILESALERLRPYAVA